MATIITASLTTAGTNITLANGVDLFVGPDAVRVSSAGTGLSALFATHSIDILGTLYGDSAGIALGAAPAASTNSFVTIGADATVMSRVTGIRSQGNGVEIFNDGLIKGGTAINHDGASLFRLVNTGQVVGTTGNAIDVDGQQGSIVNHGTITGLHGYGITLTNVGGLAPSTRIVNYGTIEGGSGAILGADNVGERIENHGTIISNIALLGGDDYYDGHDGTVSGVIYAGDGLDTVIGGAGRDFVITDEGDDSIEGGAGNDVLNGGDGADTLDGGEGDDVIRPGAEADVIDGGAGLRDVLDYSLGLGPVTVNLGTGDADGGDATGDIFAGIEDVIGSVGLDVLTGDALANRLFGGGSSDLLSGANGNDILVGGAGVDTLTGGLGADVLRGGTEADIFRFALASESGTLATTRDRIVGFSQAELDRIDVSALDANLAVAGNQAFAFTAGAAFTAAGQVRAQVVGGNTFVYGNTDAVLGTAEFSIVLNGVVALAGADFVL